MSNTVTIESILHDIEQLQSWEKIKLLKRIDRGGENTIYGRYRFEPYAYH